MLTAVSPWGSLPASRLAALVTGPSGPCGPAAGPADKEGGSLRPGSPPRSWKGLLHGAEAAGGHQSPSISLYLGQRP